MELGLGTIYLDSNSQSLSYPAFSLNHIFMCNRPMTSRYRSDSRCVGFFYISSPVKAMSKEGHGSYVVKVR